MRRSGRQLAFFFGTECWVEEIDSRSSRAQRRGRKVETKSQEDVEMECDTSETNVPPKGICRRSPDDDDGTPHLHCRHAPPCRACYGPDGGDQRSPWELARRLGRKVLRRHFFLMCSACCTGRVRHLH
jgi:hypothetical protein